MQELEIKNVNGKDYKKLIGFFGVLSDSFSLTLVDKMMSTYDQTDKSVLNFLAPYLIKKKRTNHNVGTTDLRWRSMTVLFYQINSETLRCLKNSVSNLFAWGYEEGFPEDLTFYSKGNPLLFVIGHEQLAYVRLENEKQVKKLTDLNGIIFN